MPDIATLTLNPAIDLWSEAEVVRPTHKIRTANDRYDPGGGGINVARALHALGTEVEAVALAGGVTGDLLGQLLAEAGVAHRLLPIAGRTRINHVVAERRTGREFRFVLAGPPVSAEELAAVERCLDRLDVRFLVASGSLPPNAPVDTYARLAARVAAKGARFVLDTSGDALTAALDGGHVFLVKPSLGELEHSVGHALREPALQEAAARRLVATGKAAMVALSLGADGALLASAEGIWRRPAIPVEVRSTVGAGDSFLAGLVWSLARGDAPGDALGWAMATAAASLSQPGTKLCTKADVLRLHG